jgi:hypothetical protein
LDGGLGIVIPLFDSTLVFPFEYFWENFKKESYLHTVVSAECPTYPQLKNILIDIGTHGGERSRLKRLSARKYDIDLEFS